MENLKSKMKTISNNRQDFSFLSKLNVSPVITARYSMYMWCLLFNRDIEPKHNYRDKFFTILNYEFERFLNSQNDLLLLEAPPRTGKTEFDINIFLCWLLGSKSNNRFLITVSNRMLKVSLRKKIERVLRSPLFASVFPDVNIEICNESHISLTNGNEVSLTTTYSMTPIGVGFHWIFLIDFLVSETMSSEANRMQAFEQLEGILSRTEHTPATKILVDNQRLGLVDLSAFMTHRYDEMGLKYHRITLPYLFEQDWKHEKLPIMFKKGEYLVSRFNDFERMKVIARVGNYRFDTEFQQKPRRPEGDLVKREMFMFYNQNDLENIQFKNGFMTTDNAYEDKKKSDYNVYCFWLVDEHDNLYLIDMLRKKMKGILAEKLLWSFYCKWKEGLKNGGAGIIKILIENTTNTKLTVQKYKNGFYIGNEKVMFGSLIKELPRKSQKFVRFKQAIPFIESGKLYLPNNEVKIDGINDVKKEIIDPLIRECEEMREDDSHEHDDIVDNVIDAINECQILRSQTEVEIIYDNFI